MIVEFILGLITIIVVIYVYIKLKFSYWKRLGVPYIEPSFPFGNIQGFTKKMHSSQQFLNYYNEFKQKSKIGFGGIYFFVDPVIVPSSLEFLKSIFVKDFPHFHDRTFYYNEKDDPISAHLSAIDGQKWRTLREKLSPTFTSGKLKGMFPSIVSIGENMRDVLNKMIEEDPNVMIKTLLVRFTSDIIGSCAFGIDCNSLKNPDAEIYQTAMKIGRVQKHSFIVRLMTFSYPNLMRFFRVKVFPEFLSNFFYNLVKDIVEHREKNSVERNDFMNQLIQLKNTGTLKNDAGKIVNIGYLTFGEVVAQSFVFFLGGFETSSTTLMFCLYELAVNQEIQDRARKEILETLEKHDDKITYESLSEMNYLEQCINETLRKYPSFTNVTRKVTKDYKVPNSDITLAKGTIMIIPIYSFHHDPTYFPNPDVFDPDRFCPEEVEKRTKLPFTPYIPFGEGPRICIGMRFGMLETKIGMITLLSNFRFSRAPSTKVPLVFHKRAMTLSPDEEIILKIEKL